MNRPHLINSYEVGITAGPLALCAPRVTQLARKISFIDFGYS